MLTNSRATTEGYSREEAKSCLGLLERENTVVDSYASIPEVGRSEEINRYKMSENLSRILNYDKYVEAPDDTIENVPSRRIENIQEKAETIEIQKPVSEEDVMPSPTTLQFLGQDKEEFYKDAKKESAKKESYKLNYKGKTILALYVAAVVAIIALIILNTTVLASIRASKQAYIQEYDALIAEATSLSAQMEELESVERVVEEAEKLGMVNN